MTGESGIQELAEMSLRANISILIFILNASSFFLHSWNTGPELFIPAWRKFLLTLPVTFDLPV